MQQILLVKNYPALSTLLAFKSWLKYLSLLLSDTIIHCKCLQTYMLISYMITVSARIEPHSWLDPHPKKNLIDPQSKTDIETIEPHLELTPTQLVFIWGGTRNRPGLDSKWEKPAMYMQQCTCNNAHATMHMQQCTCNGLAMLMKMINTLILYKAFVFSVLQRISN